MSQIRFHVTAGREDAQRIYAALEARFEEEAYPLAMFEVDEDRDLHQVSLYVAEGTDLLDEISRTAAEAVPGAKIDSEDVPDIDWVTHSLEGLKPVRASRFVVHGSHDRVKRRIGDIAIEIDAGLAFGTGHHGTTSGCLEMIDRVVRQRRPRNALDLGTGSAVLAIALAKLARTPVLATDIDPVATRVATANVRLNQVTALVETATATGFHHPVFARRAPFDLIVANILARPLMRLAPEMAGHLAPGGSLILSGILDRQRDAVIAAYVGQRFRHVRTSWRQGWVTLHLKR